MAHNQVNYTHDPASGQNVFTMVVSLSWVSAFHAKTETKTITCRNVPFFKIFFSGNPGVKNARNVPLIRNFSKKYDIIVSSLSNQNWAIRSIHTNLRPLWGTRLILAYFKPILVFAFSNKMMCSRIIQNIVSTICAFVTPKTKNRINVLFGVNELWDKILTWEYSPCVIRQPKRTKTPMLAIKIH